MILYRRRYMKTNFGELSVGVDIGTTTISVVVFDIEHKKSVEIHSVPHHSYIFTDIYSEQDVFAILEQTEEMLDQLIKRYPHVVSIGITGQMHGIVYVNGNGEPISNLINWQDKRADQELENGKTTCQWIESVTGQRISTGYGIATHFCNLRNRAVPNGAVGFCSIMDLFAMRICGLKKALTHTSIAASFGLFDVKEKCFIQEKLSLIGIEEAFLPEVTEQSRIIGLYKGIPVSVAIGDNQASILGAVRDNASDILVNIGTGSQVSVVSDCLVCSEETEVRPFVEGKYLVCGSALCGGFAYSMLEAFFRSFTESCGIEGISIYEVLNALAERAYESGEEGLEVDVSFCGKRNDPLCRGSIQNIGRYNFTPSALALGVLRGMCNELYALYVSLPEEKSRIVASGGAVRKVRILRRLLEDRFGMPVSVNTVEEEAAVGAALFSALALGKLEYDDGFRF